MKLLHREAFGAERLRHIAREEDRPRRVVELEIAAAGIVEGPDRFAVSEAEIMQQRFVVFVQREFVLAAELQHVRARNGHLRHGASGYRMEITVMIEHRVIGKIDLAGDLDRMGFGRHAVELNAGFRREPFDAVEMLKEIEMPPSAAEFAVRHDLHAGLLLKLDRAFDLFVFDRFELRGVDLPGRQLHTRLLDRLRSQQTADLIRAKRRKGAPKSRLRSLCHVPFSYPDMNFGPNGGRSRFARLNAVARCTDKAYVI